MCEVRGVCALDMVDIDCVECVRLGNVDEVRDEGEIQIHSEEVKGKVVSGGYVDVRSYENDVRVGVDNEV